MKREELKKLFGDQEIDDAIIDKIMAMNGKDVNKAKDELTAKDEEIGKYQSQISELTDSLKNAKADDAEALQAKISEWEGKFNQLTADVDKSNKERQILNGFEQLKCNDSEYGMYKVGFENFKFTTDGKLVDFDKTVSDFKNANPHLFSAKIDAQIDDEKPPVNNGDESIDDFMANFFANN